MFPILIERKHAYTCNWNVAGQQDKKKLGEEFYIK